MLVELLKSLVVSVIIAAAILVKVTAADELVLLSFSAFTLVSFSIALIESTVSL